MLPTLSPDARAHKNLKKKVRPSIFVRFYVHSCHIRRRQKQDYLNRGKYNVSGKRQ